MYIQYSAKVKSARCIIWKQRKLNLINRGLVSKYTMHGTISEVDKFGVSAITSHPYSSELISAWKSPHSIDT